MRWPWQRRGRRRRTEVVAKPPIEQWAPGWAETFLPQSAPGPVVVTAPPTSMVRLGFSDGTELELAAGNEHFGHLVDAAGRLTDDDLG
jgi:hypothetical protein